MICSSKKWILNSTRSVRASGSRTCIIVYTKLTMIPFASIGPIFYPFVLRDEKDDIIEEDDLLNPDSFLSGGKQCWTFLQWILFKSIALSINSASQFCCQTCLCSGELGISAVSPPQRKLTPESRLMPVIGKPNHSTPRFIPKPLSLAVSKLS